jgi:hypothetical protein
VQTTRTYIKLAGYGVVTVAKPCVKNSMVAENGLCEVLFEDVVRKWSSFNFFSSTNNLFLNLPSE